MRLVRVYIDGFNLYYGSLKETPFKWLDLSSFSQCMIPKKCRLDRVKYFTARLKALPHDPSVPSRQHAYLRALRTLANVEIVLGHFLVHTARMRLVEPLAGHTRARVFKSVEKGSDVNLASHLLIDAFDGRFDLAVVVTNDSDLALPIDIVRSRFGKPVYVYSPHRYTPSRALQAVATEQRKIRRSFLQHCQLPQQIDDGKGTVRKPSSW